MTDLLSPEEFAERASLSVETVRRLCNRGELRAVKFGRQWRINAEELEADRPAADRVRPAPAQGPHLRAMDGGKV